MDAQVRSVWFNHLYRPSTTTTFQPLLGHRVCEAGNNSFLLLCVGERLPVPAVLTETVRAVVAVCESVCEPCVQVRVPRVCLHVCGA